MKNVFPLLLLVLGIISCKQQDLAVQQLSCETNNLPNAILRFEVENPDGTQFCVQSDAVTRIQSFSYQAGTYQNEHRKLGLWIYFESPVSSAFEQHGISFQLIQHEEDFDLLDPETEFYLSPELLVSKLFKEGEFQDDRYLTLAYDYDFFSLVAWKNRDINDASFSISQANLDGMKLHLKGSFNAQADRWYPIGEEDHIITNGNFDMVIDLDDIF